MMGRSPCCEKAHTNKGAWTKEEDQRLVDYIRANGDGSWRSLPKNAGLLRCGKSCRLRWINYLRPDLKRGNFTQEEDELIIKLHSLLGNKWSLIAGRFPGRTDNEIKNYWNTHIKRKLLVRGVDPQTHRPLNCTPTTASAAAAEAVSSPPPPAQLVKPSSEEGNSSSGVTTDDLPPPLIAVFPDTEPAALVPDLDLELSIGIRPSKTEAVAASSTSMATAEWKMMRDFQQQHHHQQDGRRISDINRNGQPEICLCWQLGFRRGDAAAACSHCSGRYFAFL